MGYNQTSPVKEQQALSDINPSIHDKSLTVHDAWASNSDPNAYNISTLLPDMSLQLLFVYF